MMAMLADLRLLLAAPLLGALLVAIAPARWSRLLGGVVAGLALAAALAMVSAAPLAMHGGWIAGLGLEFALELGGLALPGVLITCLIGQVASLARDGSRGTIAAGLALQGVVLAALLASNLGLLVACHGLLAPLVVGLLAMGPRPDRLRAALGAGFYLALAAAATAVAAGLLAVAHHDAAGGQWSLEIAALARVLLPAGVEAAVGALLALAGGLLLGLWPLHGWSLAGAAAGRSGTALLLFGPLRLLGLDLLLRLWLPLTPAAAAQQGPWLAGLALVGAIYGALVARVEPEPRRAIGLAALAPAGLLVLGIAGQHHEGLLGALALGSTLTLGATAGLLAVAETQACRGPRANLARRLAPLGLLAAPGLIGCVGAALVLLGTARFAGLSLGASAPWLTLAAGVALLLSLRVLTFRAGPSGHEPEDMLDLPTVDLARVLVLIAPLVVLGAWPGPWLARVDPAASTVLEAAALRRCLGQTMVITAPQRMPETVPEVCAQPLRALERLQEERR